MTYPWGTGKHARHMTPEEWRDTRRLLDADVSLERKCQQRAADMRAVEAITRKFETTKDNTK